jgi:hypothetical protein
MASPKCPKCGNTMRPYAKTPSGGMRWACRRGAGRGRYHYSTTRPDAPSPRSKDGNVGARPTVFKRPIREGTKVYIITSAQNGTPVHAAFWGCLQTITKHRGAELLVIPIRYKNPTSRWSASQANEEWWAEEVRPFLWNVRKTINENLVLLGDVKTQPTASSPLTGFDAISGSSSAILGHTKMQLRCVAAPSNRMAKILTTTGACTVANYTDSKAGKLGQFHHSLAAVVVEVVGRQFHLRQLHYDSRTQSVTDLDTRYAGSKVERAPRPLALVMGDTHVDAISKDVETATFGRGGIVETLRPQHLIWHDLLDGYSVNPHHAGNPFVAVAKVNSGSGDVAAEVARACRYVKAHTPAGTTSVIVPSNHDDFLRRWIVAHDWKSDPINAEFYLRTALEMVRQTTYSGTGTSYPSPFPMVFPTIVDTSNITLLRGNESFALAGVELGMHGDRGPNGARGSITNHRRLGVRSIIGHSHTPGIDEGAYQVGTSTSLRLEYNGGPSSWLNAHCVLHADGKRQLVIVVDGRWRG